MKPAKLLVVMMAAVFALNIAACGGGTPVQEKQEQVTSQPTVGKQLQDLDKAYKSGSIKKEEYEKRKQEIMNKAAQPD
jgi:hypothetical protein